MTKPWPGFSTRVREFRSGLLRRSAWAHQLQSDLKPFTAKFGVQNWESLWEKIGGSIDESFRFAMDWDLLLRFRAAGARFERIPVFLGAFRVHAQQKTSAGISDVGFSEMNRLRERTLGRIPSQGEIMKAVASYMVRHTATHMGWRLRLRLGMQQ